MPDIPDYDTLSNINFTGGFPSHRDLAPSIVFIVLVGVTLQVSASNVAGIANPHCALTSCSQYSLTVSVVLWRIIVPKHRTWLLYRIVLFLGCRLAMLIIRAIMATSSSWGLGLLSAYK
jgi:hypothetical protein